MLFEWNLPKLYFIRQIQLNLRYFYYIKCFKILIGHFLANQNQVLFAILWWCLFSVNYCCLSAFCQKFNYRQNQLIFTIFLLIPYIKCFKILIGHFVPNQNQVLFAFIFCYLLAFKYIQPKFYLHTKSTQFYYIKSFKFLIGHFAANQNQVLFAILGWRLNFLLIIGIVVVKLILFMKIYCLCLADVFVQLIDLEV